MITRRNSVSCLLVVLTGLAFLYLTGCATRSISDSGFRSEAGYRSKNSSNPFYKGELSEFQVIGIDPQAKVTQEEIDRALESKQRPTLSK